MACVCKKDRTVIPNRVLQLKFKDRTIGQSRTRVVSNRYWKTFSQQYTGRMDLWDVLLLVW